MKQLLKGLFLLILFALTGSLTLMPTYAYIIFPACIFLSIILVLFSFGYIKFVLKKDLFIWIAIIFLAIPLFSAPIYAADAAAKTDQISRQEKENYIKKHTSEICNLVNEKDSAGNTNEAAKQHMYDPAKLEIAQKMLSYGLELGKSGIATEGYKCAEKYANKAGEIQKSFAKKCSPITTLVKSYLNRESCWPCDITALVIDAIQRVAVNSYEFIREIAISLLGIMFLFWLAYVTLVFFGKFGFARISEYLTNVLNKAVLVLIVAALLHAPLVYVYRITVSPFVQYAAGFALTLSDIGNQQVLSDQSLITTMARVFGGKPECKWCDDVGNTGIGSGKFLDEGTVNAMLCTVCSVYKQVSPMIALGQSITCYATSAPKSFAANPSVSQAGSSFSIPSMTGLVMGMALVVLFSILMVIIGFYIMGATMKLGFTLILMPIWMVLFVFKGTRAYTSKAWTLLVHSMGTLIAISLAVAIILIGFNNLVPTKTLVGFIVTSIKSSPTEMLSSFAAVWNGEDPLSGSDSSDSGSWASGLTDHLVDLGISQVSGGSAMQTVILFAVFGLLSIQLVDKSSAYIERLINAWINMGNTGAEALAKGAGTGLSAVSSLGKTGIHASKGVSSFVAGAAAGAVGAFAARSATRSAERFKEQESQSQATDSTATEKSKSGTSTSTTGTIGTSSPSTPTSESDKSTTSK